MPSTRRHNTSSRRSVATRSGGVRHHAATASATAKSVVVNHYAFLPLVLLVLVVWVIYRVLFHFPVWFDEIFGKAVFFGLPVLMYTSLAKSKSMIQTFDRSRFEPGLLLGIAVGGIFGFAGVFASLLKPGAFVIQSAPLFASDAFWWEFLLALMTGFWESLFFYTWVMTVIQEKYRRWSLLNQILLVAVIFLVFHLPNTLLRFNISLVAGQLFLLFFFAIGQGFLFARTRNLYALTISHAIWGMVLFIHTR